jgi:hypothetical protein
MGGASLAKAKLEYALAPADGCTSHMPERSAGAFLGASVDPDFPGIWASAREKEANRIGNPKITHIWYLRMKSLSRCEIRKLELVAAPME